MSNSQLDNLCINTIKMLAVDGVEKAKSGHPGMPMGMAPSMYTLWTKFLKHNPKNSRWSNRDRYVQSGGHGSMLLYAMLYLTGYDLSLEELKNFRQWGSKTPGHPEFGHTDGVEATTGPLGQGLAMAVGMAMTEAHLAACFNTDTHKIVEHFTYCQLGDGDLMEGISHEAASLAGHLKLGKLICLYDDNGISIEGDTIVSYTENRLARFQSYGWTVQTVYNNGENVDEIAHAILNAQLDKEHPSIIAIKSVIGKGAPNKQGTAGVHGEPLGKEEIKLMREQIGWPLEHDFYVPEEALQVFRMSLEKGEYQEKEWLNLFQDYAKHYPEKAKEWDLWHSGKLPKNWDKNVAVFNENLKGEATRVSSYKVLNLIEEQLPMLMGGSADLAPSTKTKMEKRGSFQSYNYAGSNLHFGVREFAMGAICNGISLYGAGIIPYCSTFMVFADYLRPAIRLSALMKQKVIYLLTHDSIGLGEDGPTHQPIEHLASLRVIPGLTVIRPSDANETLEAWRWFMEKAQGPVVLALSRQNVPIIDRSKYSIASNLEKGAYVLYETAKDPDVVIIATGSEVLLALEAIEALEKQKIAVRVVSMPSWEIFEQQSKSYQESILFKKAKVILSVEAGSTFGWQKYVGNNGISIGIDHFGASAPAEVLYKQFGLTADNIVKTIIVKLKESGKEEEPEKTETVKKTVSKKTAVKSTVESNSEEKKALVKKDSTKKTTATKVKKS